MQLAFTDLPSGSETTFVAATPILASVTRQQFTAARLAEGAATWERPEIYNVEAWAAAAWQQVRLSGAEVPALLSPSQEALLWRTIIQERTPTLFDPDATARLARVAVSTIAQWNIPFDHEAWEEHQDGQAFLDWWRTLRSRCRDAGWMTRSDLWRALPQWIERGWWRPGPVALLGFDKLSPALEKIRPALPDSRVFGFAGEEIPASPNSPAWACKDSCEELGAAARWARQQFESRPETSIAVFVPDLAAHARIVRRSFADVFYPASALDFAARVASDSVYHLETTDSLLTHPIVGSAYLLLDLGKHEIEQRSASAILRCPFIKSAEEERSARAQADLQLRRDRELELSLATLQRIVRHCPVLEKALQKIARLLRDARSVQRVSAWAQFIADVLEAMGWPGDGELNADEQQVVQSWKDALSELSTLGLVAGPIRYAQVLDVLRRVLQTATGVPQGSVQSPVQILDARSARGLRFDTALATGLADENWPPPMRVSPLIPLRLQVQQGVPGAGIAAFHEQARLATAALFGAAPEMYATFQGSISALARRFVRVEQTVHVDAAEALGWTGRLPIDSFAHTDVGSVADTDGPAFHIVESPVPGGTGIIKSQSNCPFQAFAKYRLGAREMRDASFGYDPLDRGNFVHRSLERVWQELQTQARLLALSSAEVRALVSRCVSDTLQAEVGEGVFALQSRIAEQERVTDLICDWLEQVERLRNDSFTVEQVETAMEFNAAGLPLAIRIDRIDRLPDDSVLLIDYKTGRPAQNHLNCPRPKEPQLLVYAAASSSKVAGVYFGKVRAGEMKLIGFGPSERKGSQWDDRRAAEAREEVERLARDFLQGRAAVHPRKGACAYCEAIPICRINEQSDQKEEDCD